MSAGRKNGRGGPRAGAGRKPIPPGERQRNRVTVNLTDHEYDELRQAAKDEAPGAFARRVLVRYLARRRK